VPTSVCSSETGRLPVSRTGSGRDGEVRCAPPPAVAVNNSAVAAFSTAPARISPSTSAAIDTA
jgi:hypothetical protein